MQFAWSQHSFDPGALPPGFPGGGPGFPPGLNAGLPSGLPGLPGGKCYSKLRDWWRDFKTFACADDIFFL